MILRAVVGALCLALVAACSTPDEGLDPVPHRSPTASPTPTDAVSPTEPSLSLVPLGSFSNPVWVGPAPGDSAHLFLVEKTGRVLQLDRDGRYQSVVLDVRGRISTANEQGLLSIAFDPSYQVNRRLYAFLTDKDGYNRVIAYRVAGGVATEGQVLLEVDRPYANHNGGLVLFDPQGMLLVGVGDGGSAGDPENRAQDLSSPHGKLLRIDPRTGAGAPGNPFPRQPKVWAYGLRNPWRFAFDHGDLYVGDVGQNKVEELDVLPPDRQRGANFGWSVFEGDRVFKAGEHLTGAQQAIVPALTFPHLEGVCSVTAGEVYRGSRIGFLKGSFVFGDYCLGLLWATDRTSSGLTPYRELGPEVDGLQAFGHDNDGELLVLSTQRLYRLVSP